MFKLLSCHGISVWVPANDDSTFISLYDVCAGVSQREIDILSY